MDAGTRLLELVQRCGVSRAERRTRYAKLRTWYTQGTDMTDSARYNKLESHAELVSSYLYSPESTRFSLQLPAALRGQYGDQLFMARDEFASRWRDCGADVQFANNVEWSLVYGVTFAKVLPHEDHGIQIAFVHPGDLGVLREDIVDIDQQEVVCHWFSLDLAAFERLVKGHKHERRLLDAAESAASPVSSGEQAALPNVLQQVVVSNVTGTFPDQAAMGLTNVNAFALDDRARVQEPTVELVEVWEKVRYKRKSKRGVTREFTDWHVTTLLGQHVVVAERRNPVLPHTEMPNGHVFDGELPFVPIRPKPLNDYFWGASIIGKLIKLQAWREARMNKIDELVDRQLNPPRAFIGVMGDLGEKQRVLNTPGGMVALTGPGAKMETLAPEVPEGAWEMIDRIDAMFADYGGVPEILQGQTPQSVRAGNQFAGVAGVAAGRIRRRALIIEDALEVLATRLFRLLQRQDTTHYVAQGKPFVLADIPPSVRVKVDAHSSSPVYAEQVERKADKLLKVGAIELPDYVDLLDPPMRQELREKAKALAAAQAQMKQVMLKIALNRSLRGGGAPSMKIA